VGAQKKQVRKVGETATCFGQRGGSNLTRGDIGVGLLSWGQGFEWETHFMKKHPTGFGIIIKTCHWEEAN